MYRNRYKEPGRDSNTHSKYINWFLQESPNAQRANALHTVSVVSLPSAISVQCRLQFGRLRAKAVTVVD